MQVGNITSSINNAIQQFAPAAAEHEMVINIVLAVILMAIIRAVVRAWRGVTSPALAVCFLNILPTVFFMA